MKSNAFNQSAAPNWRYASLSFGLSKEKGKPFILSAAIASKLTFRRSLLTNALSKRSPSDEFVVLRGSEAIGDETVSLNAFEFVSAFVVRGAALYIARKWSDFEALIDRFKSANVDFASARAANALTIAICDGDSLAARRVAFDAAFELRAISAEFAFVSCALTERLTNGSADSEFGIVAVDRKGRVLPFAFDAPRVSANIVGVWTVAANARVEKSNEIWNLLAAYFRCDFAEKVSLSESEFAFLLFVFSRKGALKCYKVVARVGEPLFSDKTRTFAFGETALIDFGETTAREIGTQTDETHFASPLKSMLSEMKEQISQLSREVQSLKRGFGALSTSDSLATTNVVAGAAASLSTSGSSRRTAESRLVRYRVEASAGDSAAEREAPFAGTALEGLDETSIDLLGNMAQLVEQEFAQAAPQTASIQVPRVNPRFAARVDDSSDDD